MTDDQVKDLIREWLRTPEGVQLVREALAQDLRDLETRAVVEAQLGVKDECLKPKP